MPPPKKPKNGPTTVEQFLSREELQRMEETASGMASAVVSRMYSRSSTTPPDSEKSQKEESGDGSLDGEESGKGDDNVREGEGNDSSASASGETGQHTGVTTASASGSEAEASDSGSHSSARIGILRQLFSKREMDTQGDAPCSVPVLQVVPPPAESTGKSKHSRDKTSLSGIGGGGRGAVREHWPPDRSGGNKPHSGVAHHEASAGFPPQPSGLGLASGGSGGSNVQGEESLLSSKRLTERSYLTSLIKGSPPASSGAMTAPSLERAALNSGNLLHGLMGAPAPPTYIHTAFQLPLMDTSTSGHTVTGPVSTSVLAYLAAQGTHHHPHSPLPPLPHLPRCCMPTSLPLVDSPKTTSLTSFSSSFPSALHTGPPVMLSSAITEPFDLSVKKLSRSGSSADSESASSDRTMAGGDLAGSSSRPGSNTSDVAATGNPLPASLLGTSASNNNNNNNNSSSTSTSPTVVSTPPARGDSREGPSSPSQPRGMVPTYYLMDFGGGSTSLAARSVGKLFVQDVGSHSPGTAGMALSSSSPRPGPAAVPAHSSLTDNKISPKREPSDSKASGGDSGQGHSRLASSATPGPSGASPGGSGAGPDRVGAVPGMPGHSMMGGGAHLQAPTSTTPEGIGASLHPSFLTLDHHPSPLGAGEIHIKQEVSSGSSTPAKLCQVCNDNASGFHYGVWSCEGCKAFFKRSIQGPVDYMCPATNNCTIDKHRRKSCQACRLRKCYEVGMNKGSQRKERKTSGNSTGPKGKRCRADSTDMLVNSTNGATASKNAKRLRSASIIEALQKADLPVLESYHNHDVPTSRVHLLNTLIKLADRELVYLINWAKHVPGYTDLSLGDQVHLIECCWMELLLLNCAFRSMEHEGRRLVFAPDFHLDRHLWTVMGMTEILEQVSAVSEQMVQFVVTKEELLLLQAMVLVNAEVRRLASFSKILEMNQMIVDALMEVAQRTHPENTRRVPTLLLLLTHVRQAGERGIAYFQSLKREGCVAFCDLLTEMLDAHNTASSPAASASATVTVSMPSTSSSTDVDRKNVNMILPHLPHGPS